jgi:hypothetical protein
MKISNPKYFHLKIEDMDYRRDDDGNLFFKSWIGYGPITVPFQKKEKTIYLNRGTRKPKFTMAYGKTRVLEIDLTKYLTKHISYLQDKEEIENTEIPVTPNKPKQLDLFEHIITSFKSFEEFNF